jgi:release factor glutamine methyltransferase
VTTGAGAGVGSGAHVTWRDVLRSVGGTVGSPTEGRWLVERASGWEGADLWLHLDDAAPARGVRHALAMAERRAGGEPLQYALGRWTFRGLELLVDRRVLIPRPETEAVGEVAVAELGRLGVRRPLVVDLGTGSGALGLALATEVPGARVWATDASPEALAVARANLTGLGSRVGPRVRLVVGSWWDGLPDELRGSVDLVVSNPPYVASSEPLPPEVAEWEPVGALRAGPTGLEALEAILSGAPAWLAAHGSVVVEIAPHQAEAVVALAARAGLADTVVRPDLAGRARVLVARRRPAHGG